MKYYRAKRVRNIYNPEASEPFKLSRSKLDLLCNCPRCFYLDRVKGVGRPPSFPFTLNSAVDALLKKEFDHYRKIQKPHPLMTKNKIKAVPFQHEKMEEWRDSLRKGIQFHHKKSNLIITGGVDDVWKNNKDELIIVDYKATSKTKEVTIDEDWQAGYRRQMDIYAWLFKMNGFDVSPTGYFVYCNGQTTKDVFDSRLEFNISVLPYKTDTSYVEDLVVKAHQTLRSKKIPEPSEDCDYCAYITATNEISS